MNIAQIQKTILPVLKQHHVLRASIFGSFVRGEQKPDSDIDILVQLSPSTTLFGMAHLCNHLEEVLHRKVDLIQYDFIKLAIKENILKEKVDIL